jgi:hypothetical protein
MSKEIDMTVPGVGSVSQAGIGPVNKADAVFQDALANASKAPAADSSNPLDSVLPSGLITAATPMALNICSDLMTTVQDDDDDS